MKKATPAPTSDFETWRLKNLRRRSIRAGKREKDGFVQWRDLSEEERRDFEWSFLAAKAVNERRRQIQVASGVKSVQLADDLHELWRVEDLDRKLKGMLAVESGGKSCLEAALKEVESIRGERLNALSSHFLFAVMWGHWDWIACLAETGKKVCPEGISKRKEVPTKTADLVEELGVKAHCNSAILQCFLDLVGGENELLWTAGERQPFDPNDSPGKALLKTIPRLPERLVPQRLPTKGHLQQRLRDQGFLNSDLSRRFTDSLKEVGLQLLPEWSGGNNHKGRLDKRSLTDEGKELRDYAC